MAVEGSVTSVLYLYPKNSDYEAILDFMEKEKVLEKSIENGGYLGGSHNIPTSREGPMLVLASWREESDYRRWLASPVRAELGPKLSPLLDRQSAGGATYLVARDLPS